MLGLPLMGTALDAELTQMMVEVFAHEDGPLLRFERTKERVWVLRAACCALGCEAIDSCDELGAFALEIALFCGTLRIIRRQNCLSVLERLFAGFLRRSCRRALLRREPSTACAYRGRA